MKLNFEDFWIFSQLSELAITAELDSRPSSSRKNEAQVKEWQDAWEEGDKKQTENQGTNLHDAFWEKLKLAAASKVGAAEAEKFCQAFRQIHKKLVHEGLSLDAARNYINSSKNLEE
ncbi:Octanoyltransferase [Melia azedarach]|uniref:Octanoyltransferase n=1 Tax=Melia azedarach TaxID=155640 RepID=A0ACC1YKZ0_MELAZ|nr:Octanoyltransferase [Melia azedarach]